MGLEGFTNYGLKTTGGELVVFLVQPTNISVLSHANVEIKIRHLLMVLSQHPGLEIACLDSCERFDDNKRFIKRRLQEEDNPAVRKVLEQEIGYLESKQIEMSTARQFLFVLRFTKGEKAEQVFHDVNTAMTTFAGQGFEVRRMEREDINRLSSPSWPIGAISPCGSTTASWTIWSSGRSSRTPLAATSSCPGAQTCRRPWRPRTTSRT
ncbi:hypothetical protein [Acutalibacter sp. 1XD8-36]|uniref:hypothetical protein n=1 Tax=Acutalibacter sp. 1XD8-36 TaxID=2320852 RepID=UPI0014131348|nr:hypothetical protein [Acutalibacter sp. 1XD8-36]NBJ90207.1 hypothetical protein [Acutalibacter sp. 1XD8-36]